MFTASQCQAEAPIKLSVLQYIPHEAVQLADLDGQQHPDLSGVRDPWITFRLNP